eukprot:232975_1
MLRNAASEISPGAYHILTSGANEKYRADHQIWRAEVSRKSRVNYHISMSYVNATFHADPHNSRHASAISHTGSDIVSVSLGEIIAHDDSQILHPVELEIFHTGHQSL